MIEYVITRDDELYHYGVKGMKWGKRMARGHAGPGKYLTRKRQLAGDKRDLKTLSNGGHLSVGLTKKRQAAFDKRDRQMLEKRINKNENRKDTSISETRAKVNNAKADYKQAKKTYNKSFNKAYNYSQLHPLGQFTNKKKRAESDKRWEQASNDLDKMQSAQVKYKKAKLDRQSQINKVHKEINKNTRTRDRLLYNDATRKQAAKYVVDNNMSMADATKKANKEAIRNSAIFLAAYGALAAGVLYKASH